MVWSFVLACYARVFHRGTSRRCTRLFLTSPKVGVRSPTRTQCLPRTTVLQRRGHPLRIRPALCSCVFSPKGYSGVHSAV
jgi:hypothetical protein